jgi:hypothetical protein
MSATTEARTVEREHCILYGDALVCAICEAAYGEPHEGTCDRAYPAAPSRCRQCGAPTRTPARCLDRANDAAAGAVPDRAGRGGGGRLCRHLQQSQRPTLARALLALMRAA